MHCEYLSTIGCFRHNSIKAHGCLFGKTFPLKASALESTTHRYHQLICSVGNNQRRKALTNIPLLQLSNNMLFSYIVSCYNPNSQPMWTISRILMGIHNTTFTLNQDLLNQPLDRNLDRLCEQSCAWLSAKSISINGTGFSIASIDVLGCHFEYDTFVWLKYWYTGQNDYLCRWAP